MAGTDVDFDAAEARDEFREVMQMGMPSDLADQVSWRWNRIEGFVPDDPAGHPYDWTEVPVVDEPGNPDEPDGARIVPYALEVTGRGSVETGVGNLDITSALVTLMDEDWALVADADYATIGTVRYSIDQVPPKPGLFDLTVVQVVLTAIGRA